jgi:hypothetical protein
MHLIFLNRTTMADNTACPSVAIVKILTGM